MTEKIRTEIDGPIGRILIDAPDRRNAMTLDMWAAIPRLVHAFEATKDIRVIVVSGVGGEAFVSGADIAEFGLARTNPDATRNYDAVTIAALSALQNSRLPVVAAIKGICFGGGLALALACDLRLATHDARFSIPAIKLGVAYPVEAVATLTQAIGPTRAREVLFTGKILDAATAKNWGLIGEFCDAAEFSGMLASMLESLCAAAPWTIAAAKAAVRAALAPCPDAKRAAEAAWVACMASGDYREGVTAFKEKRAPRFTGS